VYIWFGLLVWLVCWFVCLFVCLFGCLVVWLIDRIIINYDRQRVSGSLREPVIY
jgi:hypothetical protein